MTYVNRKFKCKDHDTLYEIIELDDGYYVIQWRKSDGSFDTAENSVGSVENAFEAGSWYFVDGLEDEPTEVTGSDAVNKPKHYAVFEQLEAIEVIASSMTTEQFYGYCLGNILKYRLRAGGKDDVMQELGKADKYQELFTTHKCLCKDAV